MAGFTPMMEQYLEIKRNYRHCLLFFRLGDFYELFFEDAIVASKELDIALTGRDCGQAERAQMCGVPYHSVDGYIARLIEKGYKVAICEQTEDPKQTKTIVKREVVRVVTPGTVLDNNVLDETKNNYLMCVCEGKEYYAVAVTDVTTGGFFTTAFKKDGEKAVIDEIEKYRPAEIIVNEGFSAKESVTRIFDIKPTVYYSWAFNPMNARKRLCEHFEVLNLNGFGIENNIPEISASGALLEYLAENQKSSLRHITKINRYSNESHMALDISSRRNLELTETIREKSKKHSLLWVLDKTKTSMGARLIRSWIEQPQTDTNNINRRLDAVGELKDAVLLREELKQYLGTVYDIERIVSKLVYKTANARDLLSLRDSLLHFPAIKLLLKNCKAPLLAEMERSFEDLADICEFISEAIVDEPPAGIREGGYIKKGHSAELDELMGIKVSGTDWLAELEKNEREATGIKTLKIKFNKIFGYCIEITNSYKDSAPAHYIRRQTLSNCERYTTSELKEIEDKILSADERIVELEYKLFCDILERINAEIERVQLSAYVISVTDVLQSLADVADKNNYCRPDVYEGGSIDIREGRHPVVELVTKGAFIPNDSLLDTDANRLSIITGPNMAGKSTYMRQVALIVLMAQIGSFVPADSAQIGVVDRIFTRVGASDDLATGQSTFMIEMSEVSNILNNATKNSLIILDEIGRGTSTFDGLSIAWSVVEYIADRDKIGAKTLFATHYHELTELEGRIDGVNNYCITVAEAGDDIIFLRKISRGTADSSYGIHVAKLAGLPTEILIRAKEILELLNSADIAKNTKHIEQADGDEQDVVYYGRKKRSSEDVQYKLVFEEVSKLDVETITPRDAIRILYDLKGMTKE